MNRGEEQKATMAITFAALCFWVLAHSSPSFIEPEHQAIIALPDNYGEVHAEPLIVVAPFLKQHG